MAPTPSRRYTGPDHTGFPSNRTKIGSMNHSFDIELAAKHGVNEAIFIENLRFWIAKNKANGKHFYEGRYWTYNSMKAYAELFPYWTANQVRRIIESLVSQGVILVGNHNSNPYDRTQWYALNAQIDLADLPNGNAKSAKSTNSTDINTDTKESQPNGFESFWSAYPRKVAKPAALKAWSKAKPTDKQIAAILDDVRNRHNSDEWQKNDGQFIPHPATYLNQRRWEDVSEIVSTYRPLIPGAI